MAERVGGDIARAMAVVVDRHNLTVVGLVALVEERWAVDSELAVAGR